MRTGPGTTKKASAVPEVDSGPEGEDATLPPSLLEAAPPWLISLIAHTLALLILALIVVPRPQDPYVRIQAVFAEQLGDQLDEETLMFSPDPLPELEQQIITPEDLPPVDDPLAAPPDLDISLRPTALSSRDDLPTVGLALSGREAGFRQALLAAYGGTATTEAAVARGLAWLKRNQRRDGGWSLTGPYANGGLAENRLAATAMAVLAFQGAGNTHMQGQYQDQVRQAWQWLLKQQDDTGNFWKGGTQNHRLYSQAQATIALCELYGMTKDSEFREPAERAIDYAVKIQGRHGGWRYHPAGESDTSVTGWFVMALQSAMMAGLEVPSPTLARISEYLDSVGSENGSRYSYRPGRPPTVVMTAEALLCRQYLGWERDDPRLVAGVNHILNSPIVWREQDVYYWYYAAQVMHHMEGEAWKAWNSVMRQVIPENQVMEGPEEGSWAPENDQWGMFGGRLYTTCLSIYMLEVYYRHLPIYSKLYRGER
jgi:hypothetical protein